MSDYKKTAEDLDEAIAAAEIALSGTQDSDIALRIEDAMTKLNQALDLAREREFCKHAIPAGHCCTCQPASAS